MGISLFDHRAAMDCPAGSKFVHQVAPTGSGFGIAAAQTDKE
jgi:hypothetical protein